MPTLLTAQTFNCADMRFRSVLDERSSRVSTATPHLPHVFMLFVFSINSLFFQQV